MTHPFRLFCNPRHGVPGVVVLPNSGFHRAAATIRAWPGYAPTPLLDLPEVAAGAQVGTVHYKDESGRFGLGSFKALGGAYAVSRVLEAARARRSGDTVLTVCCATDGNHGRAVAWGAQRFGARCVIFVHQGVSQGRRDAIAAFGAELREVPGHYDDSVREAARVAAAENWFVVSDTAWPSYTEVPRDVMQGYRLMAEEAMAALPAPPSHIFIQGGVGGVAAAVAVQSRLRFGDAAKLVVVEPDQAACLLASAEAGVLTAVTGELDTLMAGLACGEPSLLAWQELERSAYAFMAVPDAAVAPAMRALGQRVPAVLAGESAVAGLIGLQLAAADDGARRALGLDTGSRVLLFGTEGATDASVYARMTGMPVALTGF
jgi:diaminopropionate ammonia-lyase